MEERVESNGTSLRGAGFAESRSVLERLEKGGWGNTAFVTLPVALRISGCETYERQPLRGSLRRARCQLRQGGEGGSAQRKSLRLRGTWRKRPIDLAVKRS